MTWLLWRQHRTRGAAVSALVTWWSGTPNAMNGNRFQGAEFDTQNIVPVALAVFGVALGIAVGAFFRRTLPAIAATLGAYVSVRLLVGVYLRPHYLAAKVITSGIGPGDAVPSGSWVVSRHLVDGVSRVVDGPIAVPDQCASLADRTGLQACMGRLGFHEVVRLHPASQYWSFQWIESGLFLALAAVLVVVAYHYTLRHDA